MKQQMKQSISRRQMLKFLGVGSASLVLAACAPAATEVAKTDGQSEGLVDKPMGSTIEQGKLTCLLCCGTSETHELQERFNTWFEDKYPSIDANLELTPAGQNYFEKLQTLVAAGTPPDVFDMWEGYVQPYAENGVLMDLTKYVEADPVWKMDDFQPAAVEASSYQGKLYTIVRDFYPGPAMFFYNKDLFDKAGVNHPTFDWKWDDMRQAAIALTQDQDGNGMAETWGLAFETWFVPWLFWLWSNDGDLFSEDQTKCALTDPQSYQAIQYWADLVNVDMCALPSSEAGAMQGASNAFNTGVVGMFLGYSWNIADMKAAREQGLNWGCVLPPAANNGKRSFYMHLECWAAAKDSKVPNAAWQYIRDFTENFTEEFISYYPGIPLKKDEIGLFLTEENKSYGWDRIPEIIADPNNIRVPGAGAKFDKIQGLVQAELDLVFTGDKTAQAAAETACSLVNDELARSAGIPFPDCGCIS
jgi:multiple sugar transport system substrate-binding protein